MLGESRASGAGVKAFTPFNGTPIDVASHAGGETVFYPSPTRKGNGPAVEVSLVAGRALLHRHGNTCMLHEGVRLRFLHPTSFLLVPTLIPAVLLTCLPSCSASSRKGREMGPTVRCDVWIARALSNLPGNPLAYFLQVVTVQPCQSNMTDISIAPTARARGGAYRILWRAMEPGQQVWVHLRIFRSIADLCRLC